MVLRDMSISGSGSHGGERLRHRGRGGWTAVERSQQGSAENEASGDPENVPLTDLVAKWLAHRLFSVRQMKGNRLVRRCTGSGPGLGQDEERPGSTARPRALLNIKSELGR